MVGGRAPRRILIVSAEMGEGHNAAARILTETMGRLWPGCECRQIDTMDLRGRWFGRVCRSAYSFQLRRVPWLYQFFYDALISHSRLAGAAKRVVGAFFAGPLHRQIKRTRPDLVVSTFPLGSAALHWLRVSRGLQTLTMTFVPGFDIHPFWIYPGIDLHFVTHRALIPILEANGVRGPIVVTAPAVGDAFRPGSRDEARASLGLRPDGPVALVTGGAWGVGAMDVAVRSLLEWGPDIQVVAVCGRNDELRAELEALELPRRRLVPLGFVSNMAELMTASDAVVTNGAGVTVMEALAAARPLIAFDPIAGHGRAAAALMEQLDLIRVCTDPEGLADVVRQLANGTRPPEDAAEDRETVGLHGKDLRGDLRVIQEVPPARPHRWGRLARTTVRAAAIVTVALFALTELSFVAGTRFARAARGAPQASGEVAMALAGSLSPSVLRAVDAELAVRGWPVTVFLQGRDAAAAPREVRALAARGAEIETGLWARCSDSLFHPADTHNEFERTVQVVASTVGRPPRYAAEPCDRFSVAAVVVTRHLHLRRVVFRVRVVVTGSGPSPVPDVPPGAIVEVLAMPGASAVGVVRAMEAVARSASEDALHMTTVAAIDAAPTSGR